MQYNFFDFTRLFFFAYVIFCFTSEIRSRILFCLSFLSVPLENIIIVYQQL